jgi:hypothetical protein
MKHYPTHRDFSLHRSPIRFTTAYGYRDLNLASISFHFHLISSSHLRPFSLDLVQITPSTIDHRSSTIDHRSSILTPSTNFAECCVRYPVFLSCSPFFFLLSFVSDVHDVLSLLLLFLLLLVQFSLPLRYLLLSFHHILSVL